MQAESLRDRINRVSTLAREFASHLALSESVDLVAKLDDIGKYSTKFKDYVRGEYGATSPDYWSVGARLAIYEMGGYGIKSVDMRDCIRLVIESHHTCL